MTLRALVSTSHSPSRRRAASPSSRARTVSRVRLAVRAGPHRRRHLSLGDEGEVAEADLDEAAAHEILIDQPPGPGRIDVSDPEPGLERRLATRPVGGGRPRLRPLLGRRLDAEPCGLPGEKPSIHVALDIRRLDGARRRSQIEEPQRSRDRDIARRHGGGHRSRPRPDPRSGRRRGSSGRRRASRRRRGRPGSLQRVSAKPRSPRGGPAARVAAGLFTGIRRLIRTGTPPSDRTGTDPRPGSAGGRRPRPAGWARPASRRAAPPRPPT